MAARISIKRAESGKWNVNRLAILIVVFVSSCKTAPEPSVDFETAKAAFTKFDYATALRGLRPSADAGNAEAQFMLGKIYETGGIFERGGKAHPSDYSEALRWYRRAVEKNNGNAENALGGLYDEGHQGVGKDTAEALKWYKLGSEHGNASASFAVGDRYYRGDGVSKDVRQAVSFWLLCAKQGDPLGKMNAEIVYTRDEGTPKQSSEKVKWYLFGAQQGLASAQLRLGIVYHDGDDVAKNDSEALKWLRQAGDNYDSFAQQSAGRIANFLIGSMYENAEGVPRDYTEAVNRYRLSADQGFADAQYRLGVMFVNGRGVPKDYSEGARLYRLAADQGNVNAQTGLGALYSEGKGVPKDYVQAYLWFTLAAVHGNPEVAKFRDYTEKSLTPEQVAEAQRLAREWKPKETK
jgi:uncharacterized protein